MPEPFAIVGFTLGFVNTILLISLWVYTRATRAAAQLSTRDDSVERGAGSTTDKLTGLSAAPELSVGLLRNYLQSMKQPVLRLHLPHLFALHATGVSSRLLRDQPETQALTFEWFLKCTTAGAKFPEKGRAAIDDIVTRWLARVDPKETTQLEYLFSRLCLGLECRSDAVHVIMCSYLDTAKRCGPTCSDPACPWSNLHANVLAQGDTHAHRCQCNTSAEHVKKTEIYGDRCCCYQDKRAQVTALPVTPTPHCNAPSCVAAAAANKVGTTALKKE